MVGVLSLRVSHQENNDIARAEKHNEEVKQVTFVKKVWSES